MQLKRTGTRQSVQQENALRRRLASTVNQLADPDYPTARNCTPPAASCQVDYQPTYDVDYYHYCRTDLGGRPPCWPTDVAPAGANHE